jgi:Fe-S-cluster containining protein
MEGWDDLAALVCEECGGRCCIEAQPPLTAQRIQKLQAMGCSADAIDPQRYKKIRSNGDGYCAMYQKGRCLVHRVKPETCIAGPFTFDVRDNIIELFLKKESICPLVALLKGRADEYARQYALACENICTLVEHLPAEELREILRIEEPETERVGAIPLNGKNGHDGRN